MRRMLMGLWLTGVLVAGMAAGVHVMGVAAHDATPPPEEAGFPESIELTPGVVADSMVFVVGQENPSLYRLHLDAGVTYPVAPSTSLELVYMEAGSLTVTLDGEVTIGRVGEAEPQGGKIEANTEFMLQAGQFLVLEPGVSGEVRNQGDETATVSIAGLTPAGASLPEATPAG